MHRSLIPLTILLAVTCATAAFAGKPAWVIPDVLNVREKQAAYIRYDAPTRASAQPRQVGLFVFGDNGNDVDVGARAEPDLGNSNGYNVVSWREGDIVYQLVTDLEEDDIRDLLPANPGRAPLPTVRPAPRPALEAQPASFQR